MTVTSDEYLTELAASTLAGCRLLTVDPSRFWVQATVHIAGTLLVNQWERCWHLGVNPLDDFPAPAADVERARQWLEEREMQLIQCTWGQEARVGRIGSTPEWTTPLEADGPAWRHAIEATNLRSRDPVMTFRRALNSPETDVIAIGDPQSSPGVLDRVCEIFAGARFSGVVRASWWTVLGAHASRFGPTPVSEHQSDAMRRFMSAGSAWFTPPQFSPDVQHLVIDQDPWWVVD